MTVETTLPHGLKTSVPDSDYKAEQDQNLSALDPNRIATGTFANRPAAGTVNRFYYANDVDTLYWDNGTTWDTVAPSKAYVDEGTGRKSIQGSTIGNEMRGFLLTINTHASDGTITCALQISAGYGFNNTGNVDTTTSAAITNGGAEITVGSGATLVGYTFSGTNTIKINLADVVTNIMGYSLITNNSGSGFYWDYSISGGDLLLSAYVNGTGAAFDLTGITSKVINTHLMYIIGGAV